jgi:hypothetical protein
MNIFVLDINLSRCAQYHCDKHVVKMIVEYAQMLCATYWLQQIEAPYRLTHKNHPCTAWVRKSKNNFNYLIGLAFSLHDEYVKRYNKIHATYKIICWCRDNSHRLDFTEIDFSLPPLCMPDNYIKEVNSLEEVAEAYRTFYKEEKSYFAFYNYSEKPFWL